MGLLSGPAQWVKDSVLLALQFRSPLQLRSDPWPRSFIGCGGAKNFLKNFKKVMVLLLSPSSDSSVCFYRGLPAVWVKHQ